MEQENVLADAVALRPVHTIVGMDIYVAVRSLTFGAQLWKGKEHCEDSSLFLDT